MKDYQNTPPMFTGADGKATTTATATRRVLENTEAGTTIEPAEEATDFDEDGDQESLTYSAGENLGMFVVDMATGEIRVGAQTNLNYEDQALVDSDHAHSLEVVATDPSGASGTSTVTIKVINVNEPVELADATETENLVAEEVNELDSDEQTSQLDAETREISTYEADDDEDENDTLKWSLAGSDSSKFEFSDNTNTCTDGAANQTAETVLLCFKSDFAPDYEKPADANRDNVYSVTVVVTDSHSNMDSRDVSVTAANVEEDGKVTLTNLVPEVGVPITAVLTDPDGGIRDIEWRWSYSDSAEGEYIDGATLDTYTPVTGDFEPTPKTLRAMATYRDAATEDDRFTVEDESKDDAMGNSVNPVKDADPNNKAPVFSDQDTDTPGDQSDRVTRYVHENTKPGQDNPTDDNDKNEVGNVGAPLFVEVDADQLGEPADTLTFSLGGPDEALFTVVRLEPSTEQTTQNKQAGQISVATSTDLDFEVRDTYSVNLIATDPSGASDNITVTIKIVDVDEEPEFSKRGLSVSGERTVSYPENGTSDVATYTASGADASGASWSIEGEDADDFHMSVGGVLTFRTSPNFESPTDANTDNAYNVIVKASNGNLSDTRAVTVTVSNEDEGGVASISSPGNEVKVGVQLTAELDEGDEEVVTGWQWARGASATGNFTNISGATSNTYTPDEADVGNFLRITVNYTDATFGLDSLNAVSASAVVAATVTVPGTAGSLALSPTTQLTVGDTVTAALTDANNPVASSYVWQWERSADGSTNWSNTGVTSASYTTVDADAGNYLRATVTYEDASGAGQTADASTSSAVKLHRYDGNANGEIERTEVIDAINAYLFGTGTDRDEVIEVINLYLFG